MNTFEATRRSVLTGTMSTLVAGCFAAPVLAQQSDPISVGAVLSLTGPGAALGQAERSGIRLAERFSTRLVASTGA